MRRWLVLLALLPAAGLAQVRSWEKLIAPGLTYRMEVDFAKPLVIHAYRWSPKSTEVRAESGLAGPVIFGDKNGEVTGRETMPAMVERTNALAGINADFFPWTGDPLGLMLRNGELVSGPWPKRSAIAWGPGGVGYGPAVFSGSVSVAGVKTPLAGVNQESANNDLVLNMPIAGQAGFKTSGVHVVIKTDQVLRPKSVITGKVEKVVSGEKVVSILPGTAVLSASGTTADAFKGLTPDTEVSIEVGVSGFDFTLYNEAVAGGPMVLRKGAPVANGLDEGFNAAFWNDRHPRTAIGSTTHGDIWMVVVDGRQPGLSRGASLTELGVIMQKLGCTDAMNLDGGGSSEMVLKGMSLNRPSDKTSRAVANGILFFTQQPFPETTPETAPTVIQGRPRLTMGIFNQYRVLDGRGTALDNARVIWSAQGDAWVDQGGFLRGLKPGEATLRAWVNGKVLEVKVTVEAAAPASPPPAVP